MIEPRDLGRRMTVRGLRERGISWRKIGAMLGISFERARQLAGVARPKKLRMKVLKAGDFTCSFCEFRGDAKSMKIKTDGKDRYLIYCPDHYVEARKAGEFRTEVKPGTYKVHITQTGSNLERQKHQKVEVRNVGRANEDSPYGASKTREDEKEMETRTG